MADNALNGRKLLVTGASSGIGEAIARHAASAGATVALLARSTDVIASLAEELDGVAAPADVADFDATRSAIDTAAEAMGGLDGIVNSAGLARPGSVVDGDPDDWKAMFDVNVRGLLHATKAAVPHLRRADVADVVNISSMSGRRRASVALSVYSGTKFAVHVISEGMREELRRDGIRVTVISPGFVVTPIFDDVEDDEVRERYQQAMHARGITVDDVARNTIAAISQPAGVELVEVAMLSTAQD